VTGVTVFCIYLAALLVVFCAGFLTGQNRERDRAIDVQREMHRTDPDLYEQLAEKVFAERQRQLREQLRRAVDNARGEQWPR
jgi:Flp pilus assembly protein TadB